MTSKSTKALVGAMLVAATAAAADVAVRRARQGASGQETPKTAKAPVKKTKKRAAKKAVKKATKKAAKKSTGRKKRR